MDLDFGQQHGLISPYELLAWFGRCVVALHTIESFRNKLWLLHCFYNNFCNMGQVLLSEQRENWIKAMNREKLCHDKNKTFGEICPRGVSVKPIPAAWIFKMKHRGDAESMHAIPGSEYKARIILRGQFMRPGLDYNDAFSPVAKTTTIRAVLAVAVKYDMNLFGGDVETAFLTPKIDTEIWVTMPPMYGDDGGEVDVENNTSKQVRRLLKGVPGIPQGGKLFYDKFSAILQKCGFNQSAADKCLYIRVREEQMQLCAIWVDDFYSRAMELPSGVHFWRSSKARSTLLAASSPNFLVSTSRGIGKGIVCQSARKL